MDEHMTHDRKSYFLLLCNEYIMHGHISDALRDEILSLTHQKLESSLEGITEEQQNIVLYTFHDVRAKSQDRINKFYNKLYFVNYECHSKLKTTNSCEISNIKVLEPYLKYHHPIRTLLHDIENVLLSKSINDVSCELKPLLKNHKEPYKYKKLMAIINNDLELTDDVMQEIKEVQKNEGFNWLDGTSKSLKAYNLELSLWKDTLEYFMKWLDYNKDCPLDTGNWCLFKTILLKNLR